MQKVVLTFLLLITSSLSYGQANDSLGPDNSSKRLLLSDPVEERTVSFAPDGSALYFSRNGASFNFGFSNQPDIWRVQARRGGLAWTAPINLGTPVNTAQDERVVSVGLGQHWIYFTRREAQGTLRLFRSARHGRRWAEPQAVALAVLDSLHEIRHYSVSPDEQRLLVCAVADPGEEQADIYLLQRLPSPEGGWGPPQRLELPMDLRGDERSAFLAADGKSLYFATNGLPGEGGYDLYFCRRSGPGWDQWTKPVNMGPSINSPADEYGLSMPVSGELLAFISTIMGREGKLFFGITPGSFKPEPILLLSGKVYPVSPTPTQITFYNLSGDQATPLSTISPDSEGNYEILLSQKENIGFFARRQGFVSESDHLKLTGDLIEPEDYEAPVIAEILQNNLAYQQREQQIRNYQLALNTLDSVLSHLKVEQSALHSQLIEVVTHPENLGSTLAGNQLALSRIQEAYTEERERILQQMEMPDSNLDQQLKTDTFLIGGQTDMMTGLEQPTSLASFDPPPNLTLPETEPPFFDANGYPVDFREFSARVERRLQRELLLPTIEVLEQTILPQQINMLRDDLSGNDLFAWEHFQKDIVQEVQGVLFSRQIRNFHTAMSRQQQILQHWQVPYQRELRELLKTEVENQIIRRVRDRLEAYIKNLLTLKTSQERIKNIEDSIGKLIELQRGIESDILERFASDQKPTETYTDTITLLANFTLQQDIYLHATLVDAKTTLQNIFFAPNRADLLPSAYPDLDRLRDLLVDNPSLQAELQVHTNTQCSYLFAQTLTEARAKRIRDYLIQNGVPEKQVIARGSGKLHPLRIGSSTETRKANQRVELSFSVLKNQ